MALSFKHAVFLGSFFFASMPVFSAVATTTASAVNHQAAMSASDFSVTLNKQLFSLGDKWDDQAQKQAGSQLSESFIGDVPSGDSSYKYYQHNYTGYEIYTANLFWEKEHRDVDTYIIAQISLDAPGISTSRGVSVGDAQSKLIKQYGKGMVDDSDGQHWLYYDGDGKRLSFQIENDKVSHIIMVFNLDN